MATHELALVLGFPMALFTTSSLVWLRRHAGQVAFTDARLLSTLAIEALTVALLLPYLRRRGWTPGTVAGIPRARDAVQGALVWLGSLAAYYLAFLAIYAAAPAWAAGLQARPFTGSISLPVLVAAALLNPLFEEFLWLGYAIPALGSRIGIGAACLTSVVLRVAVHYYQGPWALVGILPVALVFTWYYARTGRLWAVVVAHVITDALGLGLLATSTR